MNLKYIPFFKERRLAVWTYIFLSGSKI